jgi:hypothetical protein
MKTLFVSLVTLSFAFFVGCQSSVTDPMDPNNANNISKDAARCVPGIIKLDATILNEQPTDAGEYSVSGWIKYNLESTPAPEGTPSTLVKVSMTMNADFSNEADNQSPWKVKSTSTEIVYAPSSGTAFTTFNKTYKLVNVKGHQLEIKPKFKVNASSLAVESIEVSELSNEYANKKVR